MTATKTLLHFAFRRRERVTTTWKLRLVIVVCAAMLVWGTRGFWIPQVGNSLVCAEDARSSDLIVVDNSDQNYYVFEKAAALQRARTASPVVVPVTTSGVRREPVDVVTAGIVEINTRVARLTDFRILSVTEAEPVTLNVAYGVREFLVRNGFRSVTVTVSAFRSRRTLLVYQSVMAPVGVTVRCVPVAGRSNVRTWVETWHGMQDVAGQFAKLQYYRLWVLPFLVDTGQAAGAGASLAR